MATWAYECRACGSDEVWLVSRQAVDEVLGTARIVRVKTGEGWQCAVIDRSQPVAVEAMLLREVVASDEDDCPECTASRAGAAADGAQPMATQPVSAEHTPSASPGVAPKPAESAGPAVQAAAISIEGHKMLVVLVGLSVIQSPGEADMLLADLRPRFGGVEVMLMGQDDDGRPHYHGDAELLSLLAHVPVDRMPWKVYH